MSQRLRQFVRLAMLLSLLPAMAQSQDLTDDDRTAIRTVIERQIEAFRKDDAAGAFAFASPSIREKFGTAEHFLYMVQMGYQPVYRPQHVTFKDLRLVNGVPTQQVLLVGPDNVPVMALYAMEKQPDGVWKIDGCYLMSFKGEKL